MLGLHDVRLIVALTDSIKPVSFCDVVKTFTA